MTRNLYAILGVSHDASPREIKKRYRQLLSAGFASSDEGAEIEDAYAVLSDVLQRSAYDSTLQDAIQSPVEVTQSELDATDTAQISKTDPVPTSLTSADSALVPQAPSHLDSPTAATLGTETSNSVARTEPVFPMARSSTSKAMRRRRSAMGKSQSVRTFMSILIGVIAAGPIAIVILKVGFSVDVLGLWEESAIKPIKGNGNLATKSHESPEIPSKQSDTVEASQKVEAVSSDTVDESETPIDPFGSNEGSPNIDEEGTPNQVSEPNDKVDEPKEDVATPDSRFEVPPVEEVKAAQARLSAIFLSKFESIQSLENDAEKTQSIRELGNELLKVIDPGKATDAYALYDSALNMACINLDLPFIEHIANQASQNFKISPYEIIDRKIRENSAPDKDDWFSRLGKKKTQLLKIAEIFGYMHALAEQQFMFEEALVYLDKQIDLLKSIREFKQQDAFKLKRMSTTTRIGYKDDYDQAIKDLKEDKTSVAKANLPAGLFHIVIHREWQTGSAYLASCENRILQTAGNAESVALQANASPDDKAVAAEGWRAVLSQPNLDFLLSQTITDRVSHWYAEAISELTGINKLEAERWLEEHPRRPQLD